MAKKDDKDIFLSDIDPADGSQDVKDNHGKQGILTGTTPDQLPETPVDPHYASSLLLQREWEREQGKQAENPDN